MIALRLAIPVGAGIKVVSGCAVHVCLCGMDRRRCLSPCPGISSAPGSPDFVLLLSPKRGLSVGILGWVLPAPELV